MKLASVVLVAFYAGLFTFLAFWFRRNNAVYRYRSALGRIIRDMNCQSIDDGTYDEVVAHQRWERVDSVTYNQMVFKFWRRLDSFYPDYDFVLEYRAQKFSKETTHA